METSATRGKKINSTTTAKICNKENEKPQSAQKKNPFQTQSSF